MERVKTKRGVLLTPSKGMILKDNSSGLLYSAIETSLEMEKNYSEVQKVENVVQYGEEENIYKK